MSNHASLIRFQNVFVGVDACIDPFIVIGRPARGRQDGDLATKIGDKAAIRSHTVIYAGNVIGHRFQTGHHVMIREENRIGDDVSIGTGSVIEHHVTIGHRVRIHSGVFIPEYSIVEDDAWIGPNVVLTNARYPKSRNVKADLKGPTIRRGAKIGANSTILPGVNIGANALVGAGSVVTKDVPAGKVVAGNPAVVINDVGNLPYDG